MINFPLRTTASTRESVVYWAIGMALLFAGSQIQIPLHPIPITLQTLSVLLIGLTYTPSLAFNTLLSWLVLGALGLPLFAGFAGGLHIIMGPRGGYLLGFLLSAWLVAVLQNKIKNKNTLQDFMLCILGTFVIYACGIGWLSVYMDFKAALSVGLFPFILPGLIKAGFLALCLNYVREYKRQ